MKVAAIYAIVNLASAMQIDEADEYLAFGSNYILPKPFGQRLFSHVAIAVA